MGNQINLDRDTLSQVNHFLSKLKKSGIKPTKAIVFGSRAKGNTHQYSDIDLCLISDVFDGQEFEEEIKLGRLTDDQSQDVELHLMTMDDYQTKWYTLAHEIRTHGIEVKV